MDKNITCLNCNKEFIIPAYKNRKFCSVSCSQIYTKSKDKTWLNKRDVTNMSRYGVKSPFENEDVKNKYKANMLSKYGVSNPFLVKEFKDKSDKSIKCKYGVKVASQNNEISNKISKSLKGRTINRVKSMDIRWEKISEYCRIENLTPLFDRKYLDDNFIEDMKAKFKCNECSSVNEINIKNGYLPTCNKCSKYKGYSLIEDEITQFIRSNYGGEIETKNRSLLSARREIDIYLPQLNLAFEVNGLYWHSEVWGKYKNYHLSKTEDMLSKDIHLIHIFDYEWLFKKDIVKSIILNKIKAIPIKMYARKCEIRLVNSNEKLKFLDNNHIQGNCISKINLGLYHNNELVSIMTFGKSRFKKGEGIELIRFCNKLNTNVTGGASKLLSYFIKNYRPSMLITYADRRYSLGNLYSILGFTFDSFTKPSYFYWKNMKIFNRMSFQKHMLKDKLSKFNNDISEYENMLNNGYNRVWDCGNYKFIKKPQLF